MKVGVGIFPTDYSISPVELAKAAEDLGFESFWVPEHTHIPVAEPNYPGGQPVPKQYSHTLDPFVALGAVAAATSSILIATGICLVIERDPIITAKEVATLDHLSNGRFLFGIGAGWNRTEMRHHGTDPSTRFQLLDERVEAMKVLWSEDEAEYHGTYVDFDPSWCWPKPVQTPHPPVLMGGNAPATLERVVRLCDGWMPNARSARVLAPRIAELQQLAAAAGRDPIPVTSFGARPDREVFEEAAEAGIDRCVCWMPSAPADDVLPELRKLAALL